MEHELWDPIEDEFEGADFGDERLSRRLMTLVSALERGPERSLA